MSRPVWIDVPLLEQVSEAARQSPRQRRNHNFHADEHAPCNRLLNAIEPGSYIRPHRHADPDKDEAILCLRGVLGAVFFDEHGEVVDRALLRAGGETVGVDIPHGSFHSLVALEPGTVFFEAKAGPYMPLTGDEMAAWAPAEGDPEADAYRAGLEALFAGELP